MNNAQKENFSSEEGSQASSESLRQYYLESMGIQSWQLYANLHQDVCSDQPSAADSLNIDTQQLSTLATNLTDLHNEIIVCTKCEFSNNQTQTVAGEGNHSAELMIIVQSPQGEGQIFSHPEKTLLSKMLKAIDIEINDVFITPLLKCSPQADRTINAVDAQTCSSYIKQQIALVQPSMLFAMGEITAQFLLNSTGAIDDLRTQDYRYQQLPMMVSYLPTDLLREPASKKKAWADLQRLQKCLQGHLE